MSEGGKGYKFTSEIIKDISHKTFPELRRRLDLDKWEVQVGLPENKPHKLPRKNKGSKVKAAVAKVLATLAQIGAAHEFGVPKLGIPERPWLRPGIRSGTEDYIRLNRRNIIRIMKGEMTGAQALQQLGAMAVGKVQKYIRNGVFAPLKAATIRRKGSDKPLIDTGQMMQSITFVVREKEGGE